MDSLDLFAGLEAVASSGLVLSVDNRASLQSSLVLLKAAEKFAQVKFWGKISGFARDYFIAQGFTAASCIFEAKSFYSLDCVTWAQLPSVHAVTLASCNRLNARFTGSPSHEYTVTEPGPSASDAPLDLPREVAVTRKQDKRPDGSIVITTTVKEDVRLAAVVRTISLECTLAPRGAYRRSVAGLVEPSRLFDGLSSADAARLQSYLKVQGPVIAQPDLSRGQADRAVDFLPTADRDIPQGSWSVQSDRGGATMLVRSLLWPGFTAFNQPGTRAYGCVYNGLAQRNLDLAFMLP